MRMAIHKINLELTTQQLIHLNNAMNDIYDANADALSTAGFEDERLPLLRQCEALQTFMESIGDIVAGAKNAQ